MSVHILLLVIAVVLMAISAFNVPSKVDLFKLGWAFVIASLIL